jgi:hypothetical protein
MAKLSDQVASAPKVGKTSDKKLEKAGGPLAGLFAEENEFDRRALWRIGSWGAAAVGAVTVAVMSNQWSLGLRREQVAAADLARQAQQIQSLTRESQNETRRLASAIETLNNDRDRLFSRVTVIEQGLDSVTGALAKQAPSASAAPQASAAAQAAAMPGGMPQTPQQNAAAPVPAPVATTASGPDKARADASAAAATANPAATANAGPATTAAISPNSAASPSPAAASLMTKSIMGPPDPAAPRLIEIGKSADAKPADPKSGEAKLSDAKAVNPKMAEANVDARLDAKAEGNGPDASAASSEVVASASPMDEADAEGGSVAAKRTDFAVDLGSANSLGGLRAIWRGVRHVNAELGALNPIVVIREGHTGPGMQLHLAAGPLKDAAAAAKICAVLAETRRSCETTVYDGQRLAMSEGQSLAAIKPGSEPKSDAKPAEAKGAEDAKVETKPGSPRRGYRHAKKEEPPPPPAAPPKPESTSTFSSLFGRKSQ